MALAEANGGEAALAFGVAATTKERLGEEVEVGAVAGGGGVAKGACGSAGPCDRAGEGRPPLEGRRPHCTAVVSDTSGGLCRREWSLRCGSVDGATRLVGSADGDGWAWGRGLRWTPLPGCGGGGGPSARIRSALPSGVALSRPLHGGVGGWLRLSCAARPPSWPLPDPLPPPLSREEAEEECGGDIRRGGRGEGVTKMPGNEVDATQSEKGVGGEKERGGCGGVTIAARREWLPRLMSQCSVSVEHRERQMDEREALRMSCSSSSSERA